MAMIASFLAPSSASPPCRHSAHLTSHALFPVPRFKKGVCGNRFLLLKLNCVTGSSKGTSGSESEVNSRRMSSSPSLLKHSSSPSNFIIRDNGSSSAYKWCAALGGVGLLETAYLTYLKVTDSGAFCPVRGDSCNAILTNDHSSVFGAPPPLFGMVAHGLVTILGLRLQMDSKPASGIEKTDGEMILLGMTTCMAIASAYFSYILSNEFIGESCLFCLASTSLSFSLCFITLKNFGLDRIREMLGSQMCVIMLSIVLSTSYNAVFQPVPSSLAATELPYVETEITKESTPLALSLAKHLQSIGAKLYGAFWCSHCVDQKQMFGHEAEKLLNYVECYPDGVKQGTKMAKACSEVDLKYFPSWEINGQVFSGKKQFSELARLSGIKLED